MTKKWTNEEIEWLIKNYPTNGTKYCANFLNKTIPQINSKRQKLQLHLTQETNSKINKQRHQDFMTDKYKNMAQNFIDCKNPEHVYILGFLFADGYVDKNSNRIACSITRKDGDILESIFNKTGNWNIRYYEGNTSTKPQTIFRISNSILHKFLLENDYKVKSWESADKILSKIPEHLQHYWFRGLMDGDGYIGKAHLTICSGYNQDWNYMEQLCKKLNIKSFIVRREEFNKKANKIQRHSIFCLHKRETKVFLDYIYQNVSKDKIGLERKLYLYKQYYSYDNFSFGHSKYITFNGARLNYKDWAKKLNIKYPTFVDR